MDHVRCCTVSIVYGKASYCLSPLKKEGFVFVRIVFISFADFREFLGGGFLYARSVGGFLDRARVSLVFTGYCTVLSRCSFKEAARRSLGGWSSRQN